MRHTRYPLTGLAHNGGTASTWTDGCAGGCVWCWGQELRSRSEPAPCDSSAAGVGAGCSQGRRQVESVCQKAHSLYGCALSTPCPLPSATFALLWHNCRYPQKTRCCLKLIGPLLHHQHPQTRPAADNKNARFPGSWSGRQSDVKPVPSGL